MMKSEMKAELESVYCNGIEYFSKTYLKEKVLQSFSSFVSLKSNIPSRLFNPNTYYSKIPTSSSSSSFNSSDFIFHTCNVQSSLTDAKRPSSSALHRTSRNRSVCPWCVNTSSAGPSSASSAVCSFPICISSHRLPHLPQIPQTHLPIVAAGRQRGRCSRRPGCASHVVSMVFQLVRAMAGEAEIP